MFELLNDQTVVVGLSAPAIDPAIPVKAGWRLKVCWRVVQNQSAEVEAETHGQSNED